MLVSTLLMRLEIQVLFLYVFGEGRPGREKEESQTRRWASDSGVSAISKQTVRGSTKVVTSNNKFNQCTCLRTYNSRVKVFS